MKWVNIGEVTASATTHCLREYELKKKADFAWEEGLFGTFLTLMLL
jgi:hypothetical protein